MSLYTDQTDRKVEIITTNKIISLVPSQTELLFDLGLNEEVIGITKFCVHPQKWFRTKTRIGGTKNVNIEKIKSLQPTLIIANKEENVKEQIEELAKHFPVWVSDVDDLESSLQMIKSIGEITGTKTPAQKIIEQIKHGFRQLSHDNFKLHRTGEDYTTKPNTQNPRIRPGYDGQGKPKTQNSRLRLSRSFGNGWQANLNTAYLIWKDPYLTTGGDTFISNMLQLAGFQNIFANKTRYPEVTIEQLFTANCQLLLLSSEPYPFGQKHIDELQQQLPNTKIFLVDGEMFSWYGSRLIKASLYFAQLKQKIDSLF